MPPVPRHNYSLWIIKYPPTILPPGSLEGIQRSVFEGIHTPNPLIWNDPAPFWCPSWGFACACFYASWWYLSDVHYVKCTLVTANIWFCMSAPGIVQWIISACETKLCGIDAGLFWDYCGIRGCHTTFFVVLGQKAHNPALSLMPIMRTFSALMACALTLCTLRCHTPAHSMWEYICKPL